MFNERILEYWIRFDRSFVKALLKKKKEPSRAW